MGKIEFQLRKAFFQDPFFADCWEVGESTTRNQLGRPSSSGKSASVKNSSLFQVILDVQLFKPDEVTVLTNSDLQNYITIEGKHEERSDPCHGYITRQFQRQLKLPSTANMDKIECNLSSDGILVLSTPLDNTKQRKVSASDMDSGSEATIIPAQSDDLEERVCETCHNPWSKMRRCDPHFHIVPTYELIPWWERRFSSDRFRKNLGIHSDHENYKVLLDVTQFVGPGELNVTCSDHIVSIEGKHGAKRDSHGNISRQFTCQYDLPKSVDSKDIDCSLSPNGILEIIAVKKKGAGEKGRKIEIDSSFDEG